MCWTILKLPFKNHWCRTVWLPLNGTVGEGRTAERRGSNSCTLIPRGYQETELVHVKTEEHGWTQEKRLDFRQANRHWWRSPTPLYRGRSRAGWEGSSCFANVCKHNSSLERQMQKTRDFGAVFTNTSRMGFLLTLKHAFQTPSSGQQL